MSLTADERDAFDAMKAEAHDLATRPDGSMIPGAAAVHYVRLLHDAEGIAPDAIAGYVDALARKGAAKVLADWRRARRTKARTAKGTPVDAPRYAGTIRPDGDGTPQHVQVELPGMTVDELRGHKRKLETSRNTLSREIRLVSDLIEVCEVEGYATASDALAHLARAS